MNSPVARIGKWTIYYEGAGVGYKAWPRKDRFYWFSYNGNVKDRDEIYEMIIPSEDIETFELMCIAVVEWGLKFSDAATQTKRYGRINSFRARIEKYDKYLDRQLEKLAKL